MNTNIFASLDKAGFCKVEKGRQLQNDSISRWSWCGDRNHPRFLYVSLTLTDLIHKELCLLPPTECEWGVLSSTFLFFWILTLKPNFLKEQVATNSSAMEDEVRHINSAFFFFFLPDSILPVTAQVQRSTKQVNYSVVGEALQKLWDLHAILHSILLMLN